MLRIATYTTIASEVISTTDFTREEREFLEDAVAAWMRNEAYTKFFNRVHVSGSAMLQHGSWITPKIAETPLYRICMDLVNRLGVKQGFLKPSPDAIKERCNYLEFEVQVLDTDGYQFFSFIALNGESVDIHSIERAERAFLEQLFDAFVSNMPYANFLNLWGNQTSELLYSIFEDVAHRLAVQQNIIEPRSEEEWGECRLCGFVLERLVVKKTDDSK